MATSRIKQTNDFDLILDLHLIIFGKGEPKPTQEETFWWIAYKNKEPIAFAGMRPSGKYKNTGYLCRVGVLRSERGHGLQKRFIRVREMKARKLGYNQMVTDTSFWNISSSNNLVKCRYKLFEPEAPWSFKNSLYWKKEL